MIIMCCDCAYMYVDVSMYIVLIMGDMTTKMYKSEKAALIKLALCIDHGFTFTCSIHWLFFSFYVCKHGRGF